jgi:hypothetical protein
LKRLIALLALLPAVAWAQFTPLDQNVLTNENIAGDAGVAGNTTLTGAATLGSTLQVATDGGFGGNLTVAGTGTIRTLVVSQDGGVGGNLTVSGTTTSGAGSGSTALALTEGAKIVFGSNTFEYMTGTGNALQVGGGNGNLLCNAVQTATDGYVSTGSAFLHRQTLDTCDSGNVGRIEMDSTGGTGAKYNKLCICDYNGTTRAWRNLSNPVATAIGNTTTCPDNL